MAVNPFLRGMTGGQMGIGRPSLAQMMAPATAPTPTVAGPTVASAQPLNLAGLRRQVLAQAASPTAPTAPQSRQALLAKYGLAPTAPTPAPSIMQRLSSALPAAGTPEMAGLGAAGRTMLELSGYQPIAQAPSIGQILARSAEAGIGVMEKKQAAEQARAQAEAQAQAEAEKLKFEQDLAMKELRIKQDKEAREAAAAKAPKGPMSAAGKYALDLGLTPGTPEFTAAMEKFTQKESKPSENLFSVTIPGQGTMEVRGDDPALDKYLGESGKAIGARVTKAGQLVGSKDDVLAGLTKAEYSKQVMATFNAQENIARLENVADTFEDDFLRLGGKIELAGAKFADWGNFASEEQKDLIKRVSDWQLNAWNQVNDRIKAITGAQMSEAEAKRIMKELPDPSKADFFKISSPAEYKAKLERALQNAKLAVARQQYFLKNGLEPTFYKTERTEKNPRGYDVFYESDDGIIGLDSMKGIMSKKAAEFAKQYEGLPEGQARQMIIRDMQSMFGLGV